MQNEKLYAFLDKLADLKDRIKEKLSSFKFHLPKFSRKPKPTISKAEMDDVVNSNTKKSSRVKRLLVWCTRSLIGGAIVMPFILLTMLGLYWSQEPDMFDVSKQKHEVPGQVFTGTLIKVAETLLDKPGGYMSNDKIPPSNLFGFYKICDNIPSWEFGALTMVRDTSRTLRNDFSRSQSQSVENPFIAKAEPLFHFNNNSWLFPRTEGEYRDGINLMKNYLEELGDPQKRDSQFYTRADNLEELLKVVEKRLGGLIQRLNASVKEVRVNTDLSGDPEAQQSTPTHEVVIAKTPWLEIDNVFYESRGYVWALLHILKAVEIDFNDVLMKKNAKVELQQVIRLLEESLSEVSSPMILNGSPMGWVPNYSRSMVSYISPANSAIIDLRNLLNNG